MDVIKLYDDEVFRLDRVEQNKVRHNLVNIDADNKDIFNKFKGLLNIHPGADDLSTEDCVQAINRIVEMLVKTEDDVAVKVMALLFSKNSKLGSRGQDIVNKDILQELPNVDYKFIGNNRKKDCVRFTESGNKIIGLPKDAFKNTPLRSIDGILTYKGIVFNTLQKFAHGKSSSTYEGDLSELMESLGIIGKKEHVLAVCDGEFWYGEPLQKLKDKYKDNPNVVITTAQELANNKDNLDDILLKNIKVG